MNNLTQPLLIVFSLIAIGLPASVAQFRTTVSSSATTSAASFANAVSSVKPGLQFGDESGWELYLAGRGSFWSHQDSALSLTDVLQVTPNQPLPTNKLAIRQSFARGGRIALGLVKNINEHSALEFSYAYSTSNFNLTALEDGSNVQISEIKKGMVRSLGMHSHITNLNYHRSLVNNKRARFYLTGGLYLTVFQPNDDGLDRLFGQLPNFDPDNFKQKPRLKTVAAPGVNFGAGVIIKVHESVGLRFDVRDYLSFTKRIKGSAELNTGEKLEVSLFGKTLHNLVTIFGAVFTPQ